MMESYHNPVLLRETVEHMVIEKGGTYVDATYGGGGHTKYLLDALNEKGTVVAFDQDEDAIKNKIDDPRLILLRSNFRYIGRFIKYLKINKVDGVMADLGVSSYQLDEDSKGFSFTAESTLDMRMNSSASMTAADVVNNEHEADLVAMFSAYGEVRNARSLARAIVKARSQRPITSIQEFLLCLEPMIMGNRSRYLAQVFQAIRIKVNDEIGALKSLLTASAQILKVGGRLSVLTYHSLEDRVVKHFVKRGAFDPRSQFASDAFGEIPQWCLKPVNRKPILPSREEIENNSRARSAKLRVAEKTRSYE